jgi:hypothetical protein
LPGNRPERKTNRVALGVAEFWDFSSSRDLLKESERLLQIKEGFSAYLVHAIHVTFDLQERSLATLLNASISTLGRSVFLFRT